jgi:hypothetical protein
MASKPLADHHALFNHPAGEPARRRTSLKYNTGIRGYRFAPAGDKVGPHRLSGDAGG